jgi:anti-sigma regulatory factor (Ser/Thr protein kinase)
MSTRSDSGWVEDEIDAVPGSVLAARLLAARATRQLDLDRREAVAVVVSELATNAVHHTHARFVVAVGPVEHGIRVEVTDGSRDRPVPRDPQPTELGGRGLAILDRVADRWGTVVHPAGKTGWAEAG